MNGTIYICRDGQCQREVDEPNGLCYRHLCVVCEYDPRQGHLPVCEGCETHARRTGRDVNALIAAGYDCRYRYRALTRECEAVEPDLPDYVTVYAQGMTADVVADGVVIMSLPPRIWIKERPRAVVMILERLAECGVTV